MYNPERIIIRQEKLANIVCAHYQHDEACITYAQNLPCHRYVLRVRQGDVREYWEIFIINVWSSQKGLYYLDLCQENLAQSLVSGGTKYTRIKKLKTKIYDVATC